MALRTPSVHTGSSAEAAPAAGLGELVRRALAEDVGPEDITTTATVAENARAQALIVQKEPGVIFGLEAAEATFAAVDERVVATRLVQEGVWRADGAVLEVEGPARALLTGERTALNFLARLSGVATMSARCVRAVQGTQAVVLDTRKTTPGLRALEKAAVAAGGATNHRAGLFDAILIKDNHIALAGGLSEAVRRAHEARPGFPVEVECSSLDEVREALEAGASRLLLDNMTPAQAAEAAAKVAGRVDLECSGGVTLDTIRDYAATGVQFVSVGALTHSAPALDLALRLKALPED
ncbi:MAG TPA: carboxylating nicotinate-nucleotide diphosphorylase [Solirubrobacteraceae bacterium]|jgi:nicotinate-nucleotide pyrophosphorylase (carboxylating)|nr:carboxylating nicotinate-nucleotide diphosphorylase [Solirubrobacteraceae bacterium]